MRSHTALYRHYDKDRNLLYVGIAANAFKRLAQHMSTSEWATQIVTVELEHFPTRQEALRAEAKAIRTEGPTWNKARPRAVCIPNLQEEASRAVAFIRAGLAPAKRPYVEKSSAELFKDHAGAGLL